MSENRTVLYIGGFELPDKNAAAQRVVGIAKGLRELGCQVVFINALKSTDQSVMVEKEYYGFKCYEYKRESERDYLFIAKTALEHIKKIQPSIVIAYNYPAVALNRIRKYCQHNGIKCIADATEWYDAAKGNMLYRSVRNFDTSFRMKYVQKKLDGVIAISRFLYDYYKDSVKTVMIPPTVDISDEKWHLKEKTTEGPVSFVYAGSPSAHKERLDLIVSAVETIRENQPVDLHVIGITKEQFKQMYTWEKEISSEVVFHGRLEHIRVLELVQKASWTVIMRERNRVVQAGFPTKLVESITCGTPVIINDFSNVRDYLNDHNSIICNIDDLDNAMITACEFKEKLSVDRELFDYKSYTDALRSVVKE